MLKPLGVQLYSLRQYSEKNFIDVIKGVAKIGYKVVEPAGFFNLSAAELKKILDGEGLEIYSSHTPWARDLKDIPAVVDQLGALGLKNCVCGFGPDDFKDLDSIKRTADLVNQLQEKLAQCGIELFQHNHYWEFERINGELKYEIYAKLCPKVKFELDCFWSTNKGTEDPVAMLKKFADRTVLLHMKDGICKQQAANGGMVNGLLDMKIDLLPLGTGTLPIKELVAAMPEQVKTVIVELDYCEQEMWSAIEQSYKFMTENGICAGNK